MRFEDGSSFEETNVATGFARDGIPFRVFSSPQDCGQAGQAQMQVAEAVVYNRILTVAEKQQNQDYLTALLTELSSP